MNSNLLLAAVFAIILACGLFVTRPRAQDHHQFHREFYRKWQQPNGNGSCCNARIVHQPGGIETGDCEPTATRLIAGRWYAQTPHGGHYVEIPDSKILREFNPTQGGMDGHLCWTPRQGVICFVPPFGGG